MTIVTVVTVVTVVTIVTVVTKRFCHYYYYFLAALSSSRSLVVGWSVRPSIGQSIRLLVGHIFEKMTLRVSKGNYTLLCPYLRDSRYSSDSSDSNDISDSSDQTTLYTKTT